MKLEKITLPIFLVIALATVVLVYTRKLPNDMMGSFAFIVVVGIIFGQIGDRLPIVRDHLGGGPIVCIFGPALLVYYGLLPTDIVEIMRNFMTGINFFAFFIVFLICGAILSLSREILLKASIRYLPALGGAMVMSFAFAAGVGMVTGYGLKDAILYVAVPIMGGGVGAGALPLSQIYAASTGLDAAEILSRVMPAVILANVTAILIGVQLNRLGEKRSRLTGNGLILRVRDEELMEAIKAEEKAEKGSAMTFDSLGAGFFFCLGAYMLSVFFNRFVFSGIHTFVWLIFVLTFCKVAQVMPPSLELGTVQWSGLWVKNLLNGVLVPVGIAFIDMNTVFQAVSNPWYVATILATVVGGALGGGLVGHWVGLYFVESSIASGLCMANMAQSGDLAVLSAARRMSLLPFAAFSSRIGGSIILILAGFLASRLL